MLLSTAEKISTKLGAPSGGDWRAWLRKAVGDLKIGPDPKHRAVLEALRDLGVAPATTNYDDFLEKITGRNRLTWKEPNDVVRFARDDEDGILHFHGHWKESESVVLGIRSYEQR